MQRFLRKFVQKFNRESLSDPCKIRRELKLADDEEFELVYAHSDHNGELLKTVIVFPQNVTKLSPKVCTKI